MFIEGACDDVTITCKGKQYPQAAYYNVLWLLLADVEGMIYGYITSLAKYFMRIIILLQLTYRTLSQDLKSNIPNLPSTVVEWASFQIPEQVH